MLSLRSDKNIYVTLKGDPGRGYSKMVIDCLTQLENDNPVDCRGKLHQVCTENTTQPLAQLFWIIPGHTTSHFTREDMKIKGLIS